MYDAVHQTLIAVLAMKGIRASLFGSSSLGEERSAEFLCFKRRSAGDVVVAGVKIAGSAQRRSAGAVLQHGSVLLRRSLAAPELPGLCEITGKSLEPEELMQLWRQQVAEALTLRWHADSLSQEEEEGVAGIASEKYGSPSWTEKRRGS
jgi:lipoate-protein ligase A